MLHLLLHLVRIHVHRGRHLQGFAAAAADVFEKTEVGAARHDDHDDDDDGGAEGWGHAVFEDGLQAAHVDATRSSAKQALVGVSGSLSWSRERIKGQKSRR